MNDDDDDRFLDLHESEWKRTGKREPFWGPGAYWFFNVTIPTILITAVAADLIAALVYGRYPWLLRLFLE